MSKKALALCLLFAGAIAALIWMSIAKQKALEKETSAFATDTVNAISQKWEPHELISRAEPGLIKAMRSKGQSVADLFAVYRKLGNVTQDADCQLKDTSQFDGTTESYVTASYSCAAEFDNGPATFLITLRKGKTEEEWKVYYLNISSPYFTEAGYHRTK